MTRIDFYILQSDKEQARIEYCCRLVQKALRQDNRMLIFTEGEDASAELDRAMWEFRPESYIPHARVGTESSAEDIPVILSHSDDSDHHHDVMVNLADEIPEFFGRFKRYAHIVNQDKNRLERSRKNFKFFKDRGYPIYIHNI